MAKKSIRLYKKEEVAFFRKTKEQHGGLSNMCAGFNLVINHVDILTSEAIYQACKYPHLPDVQEKIIEQKSPMAAKMVGKPFRTEVRPDWYNIRIKVMRWCLSVKLAQNYDSFGAVLKNTQNKDIVEESGKDSFWGAKKDKENSSLLVGTNALGRLLMELREKFYKEEKSLLLKVEPLEISNFNLYNKPIGVVEGMK